MPRFSVIMTVFGSWQFLPRALACLAWQEHDDWELILMVDGPAPRGRFAPARILQRFRRRVAGRRIELRQLIPAGGHYGNVARHRGLDDAQGDYVCWVNHDNLIAPGYLAAHAENIARTPGCLSVVDVDLWREDLYVGRFPRRLAAGHIDLLCFAVPLETARRVGAFGGGMTPVYAADWLTFEACRRLLPVERNPRLVGTHF